jgi:phosphatidylserine/phosphatidylglycerophosphate/cardiolipin synthase-like enzyme
MAFSGCVLSALTVVGLVMGLTGPANGAAVPAGAAGRALPTITTSTTVPTVTPTPTPTPQPVWAPPDGGHFNNPFGSRSARNRIEDIVYATINHARPASYIRISVFSFDRERMADALISAYKRGVNVQILVNEHQTTRAMKRLRSVFGANRTRRSFIYQCERGCRGGGFLHSKFYLFSNTGGTQSMMIGSHNLTTNALVHQMNDLLIVNNSPKLFDAFTEVFRQMRRDRKANPVYQVFHPDSRNTLHVFPKFDGFEPKKDPVMGILNKVRCTGAAASLKTGGRTVIRADNARISGRRGHYIARKLISLWGAGCDIRIMHASVDRDLRTIMNTRTRRGLIPARSDGFDYDNDGLLDMYTHQKMFTIKGNWGGNPKSNILVTGSPNWADIAFHGDEIMIRVLNAPRLVNQWNRNFTYIWDNHSRRAPYRGPRSGARTMDGSGVGLVGNDPLPGGEHWEND